MAKAKPFTERLEFVREKARQIADVTDKPVLSFEDFSKTNPVSRFEYSRSNGSYDSAIAGGVAGGTASVFMGEKKAGLQVNIGTAAIIAVGIITGITAFRAMLAPSQQERNLDGYEKYLNSILTHGLKTPGFAERLKENRDKIVEERS